MRAMVARVLAATLIGVAGSAVALVEPAAAAACTRGSGVTVVVGSDVRCDPSGGSRAAGHFSNTGHSLTYVQRQPGFVCQVDGAPSSSCVSTPPADAYWGLFWSDGTSGTWTYASSGVGSLKVPSGGWVAFVFQTSSSKTYPGVKPIGPAPAPKPTTKPKPAATATSPGGSSSSSSQSSPTPTPTPSTAAEKAEAEKKAQQKAEKKTTPSPATPSGSPDEATGDAATTEELDDASSETSGSGPGTLGWVAGAIAVFLVLGMGGTLWRRRSAGGLGS